VGDTGIAELAKLRSLESLWVGGGKITDASVDAILKMDKLREVQLDGIDDDAMKRLRAARPRLGAWY